jgi:plasmid stabilization system protein ParE
VSLLVSTTPEADDQIREVDSWWRTNRAASPNLFADELTASFDIIADAPNIGHLYRHSPVPGTRRVLLKSTRYHVYYAPHFDDVRMLAVWHAPRNLGPSLRAERSAAPPRHEGTRDNLDEALADLVARESLEAPISNVSWSRVISSLLAGIYVVSALTRGALAVTVMLWFCLLPMACIWFPDVMGNFLTRRITRESPPGLVWILGWVVLLLPLWERIIWYLEGVRRPLL